ncbi:MAG: hypothetical protein JWL60_2583 [Gemmatimonadetes bacterium]|jgi:cyclophilin family peptidyl-prolyl cis-trans isomerase|nr:hypothetical protein [Gemmatimonadota bacterium]
MSPLSPPPRSPATPCRPPLRLVTGLLGLAAVGACATTSARTAGETPFAPADSALVGRILLAEDRRDSTDAALREGLRHPDGRLKWLVRRALGRIADPRFAERGFLPAVSPPPVWPEPAWRLRLRALASQRESCAALRAALGDESWPVRLRAADLAGPACASNDALVATLRQWVDDIPRDASRRAAGGVSWHPAAHAIVALARLSPADARPRVVTLVRHAQWQPRMYAARAAALLSDTVTLRLLAHDADDNVKEAALEGLAKVAPGDIDTFVAALGGSGPQAVRAAAVALKGTTRAEAVRAATAAFERWAARGNASERDVRVALLEAAGRPVADDRPPALQHTLPPQAAGLALGQEVRLRVRMSPASGGGTFVVRLRGDAAPMMAARILALARAGYYDGLTWHRVEHDFVIQGGSPGASEYVGLAGFLRDELGTVPHRRGTVGMSTRGHDTGDAQWFVNLRDNLRLDPDYTVFAEVTEGIEVVDGVMEGDVIERIEEVRPARR